MRIGQSLLSASFLLAACSQHDAASSGDAATHPLHDGGTTGSNDSGRTDANGAPDAGAVVVPGDVLTQHNDNARSGVTTAETCLRPSTVSGLGQIAALHVNGQIYGQPLVFTTGGRSLLIVATTANEVDAFDAGTLSSTPVWQLGPSALGTPGNVVRNVVGTLGILSTPVIDPATGHLYVIARSCPAATSTSGCPQAIHSIDAATGKLLDSAVIKASFTSASPTTVHTFDPDWEWNRPALLLQNGKIIAGWAAGQSGQQHEGQFVYNGYMMAFDASNLHAAPIVYVTTPNGRAGGIWQAGGGITGDGTSVYFNSGNSTLAMKPSTPSGFPAKPVDHENSVVRAQISGSDVDVASYYDDRPYHSDGNVFQYANFYDYDMSSAGVGWVAGTDDIVAGSKGGIIYLLDRTTMKLRQVPLSPFTVLALPEGETLHIGEDDDGPEVLGSPVIWRRTGATDDALIYWWPRTDRLTVFHYDHATSTMTVQGNSEEIVGSSGATLSLSIAGADATSALIWAYLGATNAASSPGVLRAYDPTTLVKLWEGTVPSYAKFACPTIHGGRVFTVSSPATGGADVVVFGTSACGG